MMNQMVAVLLLALLLVAQDKPPEKCSLSGTVVDSVTGKPLGKVGFWLAPMGRDGPVAETTSDADGHFAMVDLDPGAYQLIGDRSGYVQTFYGARGPGSRGTILNLQAGDALRDLNFKLLPGGALVGTVRDSDGEPIEGADVVLSRMVYGERGKPRLQRGPGGSTDDRGEYHIHGLTPGKYYVRVSVSQGGWYAGEVDHSAGKPTNQHAVTTFYPGTGDLSAALAVEIAAGHRVSGIDITMVKLPVVCLGGRVSSSEKGRLVLSLESESARRDSALPELRKSTAPRNAEGDFRFCDVPSGSYILSGYSGNLAAQIHVNVGAADIVDVRLVLGAKAELQGRVIVEGSDKPNLKDVCVTIGEDQMYGERCAAEDGTLTISDLMPDHYDLFQRAPHGYYVKSARSGDADVLVDGLTIGGPGKVPLEVVISPDVAELSGVVLDKDQNAVGGATVLLAPDQRSRYDLYRHITSDQRGHYEFTDLTPGSYKVLAWDDIEPNTWNDPEFIKSYEKQAEAVALDAKAHSTVNLHAALAPDPR
jgi:hypothetical protein